MTEHQPAYYFFDTDIEGQTVIERIMPGENCQVVAMGDKEWLESSSSYEEFLEDYCPDGVHFQDGYNTGLGPFNFNEMVDHLRVHNKEMLKTFLFVEV